MFCYLPIYPFQKHFTGNFLIFCPKYDIFEFYEKNSQLNYAARWKKLKKQQDMRKISKFLAFLIQMLDHTLVFVVQPPNSQKPHTSTHVLLFTFIPLRQSFRRQIFYISLSTTQF